MHNEWRTGAGHTPDSFEHSTGGGITEGMLVRALGYDLQRYTQEYQRPLVDRNAMK
jgi:hypothetical protein